MEFLEKVLQWPALAQAVLGSAIFAVLVAILKNLFSRLRATISKISKKRRINYLYTEKMRYMAALSENDSESTMFFTMLIFSAMSGFARAALSIVLGLIAGTIWPILEVVGFCVSIYFLFEVISDLKDIHSTDEAELKKRFAEVDDELKLLQADA